MKISYKNIKKNSRFSQDVEKALSNWHNEEQFMQIKTSGSTGEPKVISLRKDYMAASARATLDFLNIRPGSKALLCLPIHKIGGLMMLIRSIIGHLDLDVIEPTSKPFEEIIPREYALAAMIPWQVQNSLKYVSNLENLIIGGGPMNAELEEALKSHTTRIYHSFGMTETISHIALRQIAPVHSENFQALPNVSVGVAGDNSLVIDAPLLGVEKLRTKDLVELVGFNEFRWLGRQDNVVISGGLKFYPEEIEKKINGLEVLLFVFGLKDNQLGEKLAIVLEQQEPVSPEQQKIVKANLEVFEQPKEFFNVSSFIRTDTDKINRRETLNRYGLLRS